MGKETGGPQTPKEPCAHAQDTVIPQKNTKDIVRHHCLFLISFATSRF
jgi:hypothetical protein